MIGRSEEETLGPIQETEREALLPALPRRSRPRHIQIQEQPPLLRAVNRIDVGSRGQLRRLLEAGRGEVKPAQIVPDLARPVVERRRLERRGGDTGGLTCEAEQVGGDLAEGGVVLGGAGGGVGEVDAGVPEAVCELPDLELAGFWEGVEGCQAGEGAAEMGGELCRGVGEVGGGEGLGVGNGGLEVVEEAGEGLCRRRWLPEVRRELRYPHFPAGEKFENVDLKFWRGAREWFEMSGNDVTTLVRAIG